jgi:hypothetical protein
MKEKERKYRALKVMAKQWATREREMEQEVRIHVD